MLHTIWVCEQKYLQEYLEQRAYLSAERPIEIREEGVAAGTERSILEINGDVAVISITGVLSPNGPDWMDRFWGIEGTSYNKIIEAAKQVADNSTISRVFLKINSPGGTVDGVEAAFSALSELGAKKKLVAVNEGIMASGAYWLAVAASEIVSTSAVNETGSIGVVTSQYDMSEMLGKAGIRKIVLTSSNAPFKASDLTTDSGLKVVKEQLDAIERVFHARVAAGRNTTVEDVKTNFGQGRVLIALDPDDNYPDARSVGMIDAVQGMTFENKRTMEVSMTLQEILAQHPELTAEFERVRLEGVAQGENKMKERLAQTSKYLASEYPESIKALAAKVIDGSESPDVLRGAVLQFDSTKAQKTTEDAQIISLEVLKVVPAGQIAVGPDVESNDGRIKTEADMAKEGARLRSIR